MSVAMMVDGVRVDAAHYRAPLAVFADAVAHVVKGGPVPAGTRGVADGMFIRVNAGGMELSVSDYDASAVVTVGRPDVGRQSLPVRRDTFAAAAKAVMGGVRGARARAAATVVVTVADGQLILSGPGGNATVAPYAGAMTEPLPVGAVPVVGESVTVGSDLLADLVSAVAPAASTDLTLPILGAVRMTADGDGLSAAATDRYRAHRATIDASGKLTLSLASAQWWSLLARRLPGDTPVTVGTSAGTPPFTVVSWESDTLTVRHWFRDMEGYAYPAVDRIFPEDRGEYALTVSRAAILASVKTVRPATDPKLRAATLTGAELHTGTPVDVGTRVSAPVAGAGTWPTDGVSVNVNYLLDAVSAVAGDAAVIGFNGKLLTVTGTVPGAECIIMPVRKFSA